MAFARPPQVMNSFILAVRSCKPTTHRSIRFPPPKTAKYHTTISRSQTTYPNRYGPAATESLPPPPRPAGSLTARPEEKQSGEASPTQQKQSTQQQLSKPQNFDKTEQVAKENDISEETQSAKSNTGAQSRDDDAAASQTKPNQSPEHLLPELDPNTPLPNKELDIVLSVPAPSEVQAGKSRHPHLEPSPYEHHFDTYSLVQELAKDPETFSEKQSITIMKAIRLMLSINLDLAKEGLISKSDIENESYLFRAACSELRTTLETTRSAENQRQRTQRASLQHEFEILNQRVTQDVQTMREELKAMFNDRKMGLQEEKRKVDSQISELNYEITVLLNSEAKSEVEGLRWVLTRRAAMAIAGAAFMILFALQYFSTKSRENAEIEKKRAANKKAQEERMAREAQFARSTGTQTDMKGYEESLG